MRPRDARRLRFIYTIYTHTLQMSYRPTPIRSLSLLIARRVSCMSITSFYSPSRLSVIAAPWGDYTCLSSGCPLSIRGRHTPVYGRNTVCEWRMGHPPRQGMALGNRMSPISTLRAQKRSQSYSCMNVEPMRSIDDYVVGIAVRLHSIKERSYRMRAVFPSITSAWPSAKATTSWSV